MPDEDIYKAIMDDMKAYTGIDCSNFARHQQYPFPQRLARLSDELKVHTLRECGEITRYIDIQSKIHGLCPSQIRKEDIALLIIMSWLNRKMGCIDFYPSSNKPLVFSVAAWGDIYIRKLLDYCFKSLMAFENFPCLCAEMSVIAHVQTTEKGRDIINAAEITSRMRALGVHFEYAIIPDEIITSAQDERITYWLLGACASLALEYAKVTGAAFHHSYPDVIYSDKFFSELLRLSKTNTAILGPGMRSDESLMIPALSPYLTEESLCISSSDLIAHHLNCLHAVAWPYVVNNRPVPWTFPQSHVMIWESEEMVHFNCPHLNAWWLSHKIIKDLPRRYYQTMDSELDLICKGEDYYIPTEADSLYQAELSAPDRQPLIDMYCDGVNAAQTIWNAVSHRDTAKFFMRGMRVRINREIRPKPSNTLRRDEVECLQRHICNTMMATDPYAHIELARSRTHRGYVFI